MKRILLIVALSILAAGTGRSQEPQESAPAEPQNPSQPAQADQPSREELERAREEQRQRELEDRRQDQMRQQSARQLRDFILATPANAESRNDPIQQDYISPLTHDNQFDLASIPLQEWLVERDTEEIPWRIQVSNSVLRMDQRTQLAYSVRVRSRDLNKLGPAHDLFLLTGVSASDGDWLVTPKVVRPLLPQQLPNQEVFFNDTVFIQPGDYLLWFVLYDRMTGMHSVDQRRVRVSQWKDDPLPDANGRMPLVEFPKAARTENGIGIDFSGDLFLPVLNKRPVDIQMIATVTAPEQWIHRPNIVRSHNNNTLSALVTLSQMGMTDGSLSLTGLDMVNRDVLFEQNYFESLDWPRLVDAFRKTDSNLISAASLEGRKTNGAFFRDFLNQKIESGDAGDPFRVFIIVSSSLLFERGSDLHSLQFEGDCNCRVYHLRLKHNLNDLFDDVDKLIKPLRPRTFDLKTARDFRKALAEIIEDLATYN